MEDRKEYWNCSIGPIERSKVPYGGDSPLRQVVKKAFFDMLGEDAIHCYSGWGDDEEKTDLLLSLSNRTNEELKQALEFLNKSK